MPRGGKRRGAGRPQIKPHPKVRRDVAWEVLEIVNGESEKAAKSCSAECRKWLELLVVADQRLRFDVLRYLKECVDGKPKQRMDPLTFDPNAPLRVLVEHIGRPVRS